MPKYSFNGSVTLRDVTFYIDAQDAAEAKKIAKDATAGDFDWDGGEIEVFKIDEATIEDHGKTDAESMRDWRIIMDARDAKKAD